MAAMMQVKNWAPLLPRSARSSTPPTALLTFRPDHTLTEDGDLAS